MSSSHIFAVTLTSGERNQLLRLAEQHGTPHLAGLLERAPDMGSVNALAASVETPGRMTGARGAAIDAAGGEWEAQG
jgi:hypothetical protein